MDVLLYPYDIHSAFYRLKYYYVYVLLKCLVLIFLSHYSIYLPKEYKQNICNYILFLIYSHRSYVSKQLY